MQLIINILVSAFSIILFTYGFYIIYRVTKFFNFTHPIFFILPAYFLLSFNTILNYEVSVVLSILSIIIIGILFFISFYKPYFSNKASKNILLIASIGMYIILQNLISMIWGDDTKSIRTWEVSEGINIVEAYITPIQVVIICAGLLFTIVVFVFLTYTKIGKGIKAVANDYDLAKLSGIKGNNITIITFAIGSALAGVTGILITMDIDVSPTVGINMLLLGVVAMIIGGIDNIKGIILGAFLLATTQNLAVWYISSQWMDASAFFLLLVFLFFKPEGFIGKKIRRSEV